MVKILFLLIVIALSISCDGSVQDLQKGAGAVETGETGVSYDGEAEDTLIHKGILSDVLPELIDEDTHDGMRDGGQKDIDTSNDIGDDNWGNEDIIILEDGGGGKDVCRDNYGCNNPCECNNGEICSNGECKYWKDAFGPYVFCCTDPECPSLSSCVYADGKIGTCPEKPEDAGLDIGKDAINYNDSTYDVFDIMDNADVRDVYEYDASDISGDADSGGLSLSIDPSDVPEGYAPASYNLEVRMLASGGSPPYKYNCSGSGLTGINAMANGDKCIIKGYTNTSGYFNVFFSVVDSNGAMAEISREILFCYDITTSGKLPNYLKSQYVEIYENNTPGAAFYCFKTSEAYDIVVVNLEAEINGSGDYTSGTDLHSAENSYVHCPIVGGQDGRGNETNTHCRSDSNNKCIKGQHLIPTGSKFFVAVCNYDTIYPGKFRISWNGYSY